jgi:urea transport system substrate-binding protein
MVWFWSKGEEKAGSTNNHKVREALIKISFDAPEGTVRIQPTPTLSGWF